MRKVRGSLTCWYLTVISLALALVMTAPNKAWTCELDRCDVSWCSCVGACDIRYTVGEFRFSTDCWELVCYEGTCGLMDGGYENCVYVCCTDYVQTCIWWFEE